LGLAILGHSVLISLFFVALISFSVKGEPPAISIHLPALSLPLLTNFSTSFGFSFASLPKSLAPLLNLLSNALISFCIVD